jgi:hypothetical protein
MTTYFRPWPFPGLPQAVGDIWVGHDSRIWFRRRRFEELVASDRIIQVSGLLTKLQFLYGQLLA